MASAPTSASTLSTPGPTASTPVPTISVPAPTPSSVSVPGAVPPASTSSAAIISTSLLPVPPNPSSSSSVIASSSTNLPTSTNSVSQPSPSNSQDSPSPVNAAIIVPISAVAFFAIVYIVYRIYLLYKQNQEEKVPPPPPRTPAIFFERPQSVMYSQPPMMQGGASVYRQSMRPISMMYASGQTDSSSTLAKGAHTPASDPSTPTQHAFAPEETGRISQLSSPADRLRGGIPPRPLSVASFSSNRHSMYGSTRRGTPYLSRMEIVLPQPLAPDAMAATPPPRPYRSSMYGVPPNAELEQRDPMILHPVNSTPSLRMARSQEDWLSRAQTTEDSRSSSSSTEHPHSAPLPPPKTPPSNGGASRLEQSSQGPLVSSLSPSTRARSVSPPEPLLPSNIFLGSASGSGPSSVSGHSDSEHPPPLPIK